MNETIICNLLLGLLLGNVVGLFEGLFYNKTKREERKDARGRNKFRRKMVEDVVARSLLEMHDETHLYSKAYSIFTGVYGQVRVTFHAKIKYRKNKAFISYYLAASDGTKVQWAPNFVYVLDLSSAEYWRSSKRDQIVDDIKESCYKEIKKYL